MCVCARCSPEQKPKLIAECQAADAVVLTYACDRLSTLDRLSSYWLPELRRIQVISPSMAWFVVVAALGWPWSAILPWVARVDLYCPMYL